MKVYPVRGLFFMSFNWASILSAHEASLTIGPMFPLVQELQELGFIHSKSVADVMLKVDRGEFCKAGAYFNSPSPIGYNATISAPHMHAFALEKALPNLKDGARVLDVGSGSGYLAVCFGHFVAPRGKVIGIDHIEGLVQDSIRNTQKSNKALLDNGLLEFVVGDGRQGYAPGAPYNVIHVGAASGSVPKALLDQLAPDGIMIIPVGTDFQSMKIIKKDRDGKISEETSFDVRYVPLTDKNSQLNF